VGLKVTDALSGDCSDSKDVVAWVHPRTPDVSTPLIADGLVYLLHNDGKLECLDAATGAELWFERTHTGQHRTSPLLADGRLWFGSNDGRVSVVGAGRTFDLVNSIELGEAVSASLLVADGVLFVRSSDAIYAIGRTR
jgi:outer membrane protein assembly factor BamB